MIIEQLSLRHNVAGRANASESHGNATSRLL